MAPHLFRSFELRSFLRQHSARLWDAMRIQLTTIFLRSRYVGLLQVSSIHPVSSHAPCNPTSKDATLVKGQTAQSQQQKPQTEGAHQHHSPTSFAAHVSVFHPIYTNKAPLQPLLLSVPPSLLVQNTWLDKRVQAETDGFLRTRDLGRNHVYIATLLCLSFWKGIGVSGRVMEFLGPLFSMRTSWELMAAVDSGLGFELREGNVRDGVRLGWMWCGR